MANDIDIGYCNDYRLDGDKVINKKVKMINKRDNGKYGKIIKQITDNVYRIKLENGARTVVPENEFRLIENDR